MPISIQDDLRRCSQCGTERTETVLRGPELTVVRCGRCGLMRLSPETPPPESGDYAHIAHAGAGERYRRQRYRKERLQLRDYRRIEPVLRELLPRKGRVLEIGCGTGEFLAFLKEQGWLGVGIDTNEEYARFAMEQHGIRIMPEPFEDAEIPGESVDAVLMLHIIEHLGDPRAALGQVAEVLRVGGVLVIETPRFDTIWFRMLGHRERSVIQDHTYFFTRASLSEMIRGVGLQVLRIDSVGRTLTLDRLCYNVAKVVDVDPVSRLITRLSDGLHLDRHAIHLNLHDMMRVYAAKPAATGGVG